MNTNIQQEKMIIKVMEALDSIRPFLNADGGDVELIDVKNNKVFVKLLGNCSGCPISPSTMKLGIENTIKQYVPEIQEVLSVEEE